LTGDEWKDVRTTFSPIFTSGKMKGMMVFIQEISKRLTEEIRKKSASGSEIELKDVFGKFSMDTLASCAFGVDAQSFSSLGIFYD
jgi:cytochrome P450